MIVHNLFIFCSLFFSVKDVRRYFVSNEKNTFPAKQMEYEW